MNDKHGVLYCDVMILSMVSELVAVAFPPDWCILIARSDSASNFGRYSLG